MESNFYVYEHWRLDKDECFYVGKGKNNRAYTRSGRNLHWKNIVSKLDRIGSGYEIRIVASGLTEEQAFALEKERVAFWINKSDLCNKTDGGDGLLGYRHSDLTRKIMSEKAKIRPPVKSMLGKKHSDETKKKMSDRHKGVLHTEAAKQKISQFFKGKKFSQEHRNKLSEARKNRVISSETRAKLSEKAKIQWSIPEKKPNRARKIEA